MATPKSSLVAVIAAAVLALSVAAQSPIATYDLDGATSTAPDCQNFGNAGSSSGVQDAANRCGTTARALQFNGAPSQVTWSNGLFPTGLADFTMSIWVYREAGSHTPVIFSMTPPSGVDFFNFYISNNKLRIEFDGAVVTGGPDIAVNTWTHLAMTRSLATTVTGYVNGVSIGTATSGTTQFGGPGFFGVLGQEQDSFGGGFDPTQVWVGRLDGFRWRNRAMFAADILAEANEVATCTVCNSAVPPPAPTCDCSNALTTVYTSDLIPDAAKNAFTTIALNENTWEVEFTVHDVLRINNGHVIAHKVNPALTAQSAFTPYVSSWDSNELWNPSNCTLGALDTPGSSLGITATHLDNCTRTYQVVYSLVDTNKQNTDHCSLSADTDDLVVTCNMTISSVRAYDLTEPTAFLTSETAFTASITLPRNLNNEVSNLLYATLAKCNVLNSPDFVVDCRIPGLWTFLPTFTVAENIDWIDENSCVQSQTAVATFIRCGLNSIPVGVYTEASANISATHATNTSEVLTFSIEYTLPRAATSTASASLQNFIVSIGMVDEKYYYAGADRATLYIETFDTSRLAITQLDMFNANGQVYSLRNYPQFQLSETNNATHFLIAFRPSAIRQDSAFYRNGPHGVNVSFLFTAAGTRRHQMIASTNSDGFVTVNNINVRAPTANGNAAAADNTSVTNGSNVTVVIAASAAAAVVAVGLIAAAVIFRTRRQTAAKKLDAPQQQATEVQEDQV